MRFRFGVAAAFHFLQNLNQIVHWKYFAYYTMKPVKIDYLFRNPSDMILKTRSATTAGGVLTGPGCKSPAFRPGFLLKAALQQCRKIHSRYWEKLDLTAMQAAALIVLLDRGPVSQIALGRAVNMEPSNIHGLVRRLRDKRLITLSPDRNDARANVVGLTAKGKKYAGRVYQASNRSDEEFLAILSEAEKRALHELLSKLVEHHRRSC